MWCFLWPGKGFFSQATTSARKHLGRLMIKSLLTLLSFIQLQLVQTVLAIVRYTMAGSLQCKVWL